MVRGLAGAIAAATAFWLDRLSKELAATQLTRGDTENVLGEWVRLAHVHNSGTAFGMFPGSAPILAILSLPVLALIAWAYLRGARASLLAVLVVGVVLGAGASNTLDRATSGYVEDFIDVGLAGGPRFWTFNFSDSALVSGILLAFLSQMLIGRRTARADTRELAH